MELLIKVDGFIVTGEDDNSFDVDNDTFVVNCTRMDTVDESNRLTFVGVKEPKVKIDFEKFYDTKSNHSKYIKQHYLS